MKVIEKNRLSVSGELQDSVFFGIKKDGFAHIFNVLRNQLYSDKILAVIREYSANAYDAHIECGSGELPFEVTLPNRFDSFFKVRDFGSGLTQEDVRDIYANYGESTKRQSNDYVGQLGLGSKSAFAYADSFTITSYSDGIKYVYNAFIDETDLGKIVLLETSPTNEVDGIEIAVPVDGYDVDSFKRKAEQLYKYYEVKPTIKGQTLDFKDEGKVILEGEHWKIRTEGDGAVAVMGNIGYSLDSEALGVGYQSEDGLYDILRMGGLEMYFDIGDLEMSASREGLQYTKHTKRSLIKTLKTLKQEIIKKVQERFKGCTTHFQAKCLFNDLFDMTHDLYNIRQIVAKDLKFKNLKIDSSCYYISEEVGTVYHVAKTWRSKKYKANQITKIEARSDSVIIKNDVGNNRALLGRLLPMIIEKNKQPYVFSFKDDKAEKEYVKKECFDPEDVVLLSSLPKYKMSELAEKYSGGTYENWSSIPRLNSNGSNGYVRSTKHTCKSFTVDWEVVKNGWNRNASEYWTETTVDLESESGVYVVIDRFKIEDDGNFSRGNCFGQFKSAFEAIDIDMPTVYGFKKAMKHKVKDADGWTNFFDWAKETFLNSIKNEGIVEKWNDYNALSKITNEWKHEGIYDFEVKATNKLKAGLNDKDSILIKFLEKINCTSNYHKEVDHYNTLMSTLRIDNKQFCIDGYDFRKTEEEIDKTYPLLQYVDRDYIRRGSETEFINRIAHYVNLIDSMNITVK